ncbi:cytochrome c [Roseibacterium beibuensis]|uniref:Cytochrome c556 n=1 Tax=[Roseibacterium] beibuensis TaxID=1193142 RepID=A0ABP9KS98_9RHOB|nr:cytochrome c [Roseibacterium beibuensis]MCS6622347.1 cytochrome c [Roseibacterium beibuensis]
MNIRLTSIALASVVAGAAALAHTGATGVVLERMDGMQAMGDAVQAVAPMMRGEREYDADALRSAAETIEAHSGSAMTDLFPEGSYGAPSEARDLIWEEWDRFAALAEQMQVAARGLAMAADNGLAHEQGGMSAGAMMGGGMTGGNGSTMMGGGMAGGMTATDIGAMPADAAFAMTSQVCLACHTRFRAEDE